MEFFPPGILGDSPEQHEFHSLWYISHLVAMQERPLHPPAADQPLVYRLLYLPTFERPVVIRLTKTGGTWSAVCKRSNGQGGYSPGRLAGEAKRELSRAETKRFERLLVGAAFWDMPSCELSIGCDGAQAVLEGAHAGSYHLVDRWSPHRTPYAELVEFLVSLCRGVGEPTPAPKKFMDSFTELDEHLRRGQARGGTA